jgi:hypothetical protein
MADSGDQRAPREVLLVGSVPRSPDGDQNGWVIAALQSFIDDPAFEVSRQVALSEGGIVVSMVRLKEGVEPSDVVLGPYGFAEEARKSYETFREMRDQGRFATDARFQVTMPGPGTSSYFIELPSDIVLPLARQALAREVEKLVDEIPAADLTIQIDIAMEAEHEEWRRRPQDFRTPIHEAFDWTLEEMADSVGWLANQVPEQVELGFHVCSIWHHYPAAGQDNRAIVDEANAVLRRIERRVDYLHVPTIPEHRDSDFRLLADLQLAPETKLYLGLIHAGDGVEGAQRREREAMPHLGDFGVASFCGLGIPTVATEDSGGEALVTVLDLHRALADGAV